jgi:hypothetical protein
MQYFLLFLLLFANAANAQLSNKQMKEMHDNTAKIESASAKLNDVILQNQYVTDSLNMVRFTEQNTRNLDAFMAQRKQQEKKELKAMYWRLGFGILMFVVLIVGLLRRGKKKA